MHCRICGHKPEHSVPAGNIWGMKEGYSGHKEYSGRKGYPGYEGTRGTRVRGVRGYEGTRVRGVRGYEGYEGTRGTRVRGVRGVSGAQRVSGARGVSKDTNNIFCFDFANSPLSPLYFDVTMTSLLIWMLL